MYSMPSKKPTKPVPPSGKGPMKPRPVTGGPMPKVEDAKVMAMKQMLKKKSSSKKPTDDRMYKS